MLLLAMLASFTLSAATPPLRVLPPEAISFSGFLRKAEFDERFAGIEIVDTHAATPGWYVRYDHEALVYLFGPLQFAATADDYAASLRRIVEQAVAQRPALENHRIEVVQLPEEVTASTEAAEDAPEQDAPAVGTPPPPPPPEPWWRRLLGIFRRS